MKAASRGVGGGGLAGQSGHLSRLLPTIPFSSGVLAAALCWSSVCDGQVCNFLEPGSELSFRSVFPGCLVCARACLAHVNRQQLQHLGLSLC